MLQGFGVRQHKLPTGSRTAQAQGACHLVSPARVQHICRHKRQLVVSKSVAVPTIPIPGKWGLEPFCWVCTAVNVDSPACQLLLGAFESLLNHPAA
jgi:hypothetical protein